MSVGMKKVLIIDDDVRHDKMMSFLLLSKGFEPTYEISGEEALKKLNSSGIPVPDIILLDIMMPGMDGFETIEALRKNPELASIPIIMMSALSDRERRDKAEQMGVADYIEKPFSPSVIIASINRVFEGKED